MRSLCFLLLLCSGLQAQLPRITHGPSWRPRLVVGIVVDQMRWDYLYRYRDRFGPNGFRRLLNEGFTCGNTFINYLPSYTACGHACIYTGSVPAVDAITGNEWFDRNTRREMYCTQDDSVAGVGTLTAAGKMSPRNLAVTTIGDELRLATNFRGKVVAVALKDRGSILPGGHLANAAYWYEPASGNWITSSYYASQLPSWVDAFNAKKLPDAYYKQGWSTLYPLSTYVQSEPDEQPYERRPFGANAKGFPYRLDSFVQRNYGMIATTPYGNSLTREMALAALTGEQLGRDTITDLLAISFSSTDYVGHAFGPNSVETEDTYLRLDRDIAELLKALDRQVGPGQYLVFLSADHGVAHAPGFSNVHHLPGGSVETQLLRKKVDAALQLRYGHHGFVDAWINNQVFLNHPLLDSLNISVDSICRSVVETVAGSDGVERVFAMKDVQQIPLADAIRTRVNNGFYPSRSGDVQIIMKPGWITDGAMGTTHGSWNPYDTHIPLLWYGWSIKPGHSNREIHMTDIAPTIAALLHLQMPSGCIGNVIMELR